MCNYCCYQIMLTDPLVYPTPKSTRILTNVSGWVPRRCPDLANHDAHTAVISGPNAEERPSFFNIPEETCVFMTPKGLHQDFPFHSIREKEFKREPRGWQTLVVSALFFCHLASQVTRSCSADALDSLRRVVIGNEPLLLAVVVCPAI